MKFPKLKFKKAKISDLKCVTRLLTAVDPDKEEKIKEVIKKGKIYVLKDKKKIWAAVSYSVIGILGIFSIMYIHRISVMPDLQGKGIGSILLSRMKLRSIKIGATACILYSLKQAQNFYKKNKLKNIWRFFYWRPRCLKQKR
jgi:N-acetylglutamate synthase-like GNAT family acetyltransferase